MASQPIVAIDGAKALRRDINKLVTDERSAIYTAMKEAARTALEPIAAETRSRLPVSRRRNNRYHTRGQLKSSVRLSLLRTGGGVRMGPTSRRYAGWVEFGGNRHRPHESSREFIKNGRYLFPAARDLSARAATLYAQGLQRAFDSYHWTNEGANAHD